MEMNDPHMIITVISILLISITLEAVKDLSVINLIDGVNRNKNYKIWHITDAIIRSIVIGFLSLMLIGNFFINLLIISLVWWILFDAVLNTLRGKAVFYVGKTSTMDIWLRKGANLFKINEERFSAFLKILLLLLAIGLKIWEIFLIKN